MTTMPEAKTPLDHAADLFFYAPVGLAVTARDLVPKLIERGRRQLDPQVGVARFVGQMAVAQGRSQAEKRIDRAVAQGRSQAERAWAQAQATLQQLGVLPAQTPPPAGGGPAPRGEAVVDDVVDDMVDHVVDAVVDDMADAVVAGAVADEPVVQTVVVDAVGDAVVVEAVADQALPHQAVADGAVGTGTAPSSRPSPVGHPDDPMATALAIPDYDSLSASQVLPRLSSLTVPELEAVRAYEDRHRGRRTVLNRIHQLQAARSGKS